MWTKGTIKVDGVEINYFIKHFEKGSMYGIDDGRISKLELRADGIIIANYDRGWDIEPVTPTAKQALKEVLAKYN